MLFTVTISLGVDRLNVCVPVPEPVSVSVPLVLEVIVPELVVRCP